MKYVIDRESNNSKLMYYNVKMTGLNVKPKNGITNAVIKSKNVILIDPDLRLSFIKQRVNYWSKTPLISIQTRKKKLDKFTLTNYFIERKSDNKFY